MTDRVDTAVLTHESGHPDYPLGTSDHEIEHLAVQADAFAPAARDLIGRLDIRPDWVVADVGCGVLGILHLLAERVGPQGRVLGVDREPRMLAAARRELDGRHLERVELLRADAQDTRLPRHAFDLVHARTLLINVAAREDIVGELGSLVRAGGYLALQEPDASAWVCEPGHAAWDALLELFCEHYRRRGCDPEVGRRLPGLLHDAGLRDVRADVRPTAVTRPGDWYHTQLPWFIGLIRDSLLDLGLCTEADLDHLLAELDAHLRRPETVTYSPLWQAWGRATGPGTHERTNDT